MSPEPAATYEPRIPLSRERILRAALELADREGLNAVTMRRLGQALGVEAMSLYHHVQGKEDLVEGLLDLVESEIELAPEDVDWKAGLRATSISAFRILRRHPWSATAIAKSNRLRPGRMVLMERLLGGLRRAGFSARLTDLGYHALDSHITGHNLWVGSMNLEDVDLEAMAGEVLKRIPADEFPYLIEHIEGHIAPARPVEGSEFEFGLDLILDGLERLRDASP